MFPTSKIKVKHKEAITQQTCLVVLFPVLEELRPGGRCMLQPGGAVVDEEKPHVLLPNLPPENEIRGIRRDICQTGKSRAATRASFRITKKKN